MRLLDPFHCEVSYTDGAWVITLSGELDIATVTEAEAAAMVVRAVEGDVTLDLRGLDFMDASGVHLVMGLDEAARRYGFELCVVTGGGSAQRVLVLAGVQDRVNIVEDREPMAGEPEPQYAVIATDIGGLVTLWNNEAERVYGWSALEVLGRPILDLTVGPEDRQVAEEIMAGVQRDGFWDGEFEVRSKAGDRLRCHVRNALITDLAGNFTGFVGVSISSPRPALTSG